MPKNITLTLSDSAMDTLEVMAKSTGRSRSKALERVIEALGAVPLQDAEHMMSAGERAKSVTVKTR